MIARSTLTPARSRVLLGLLWLVFYASFTLFAPPLLDDADSVHAEVAREMLVRHDYVTLYANGIRYLEKAPLFYWAMAASMRVFGANAAAARLPLALAVLGLALLLERFARRLASNPDAGAWAGLYAGLITLSSFGVFIFSRINIPDVVVCLLLSAAVLLFGVADGAAVPTRVRCCGFAAVCALDVLTKGLIGLVFPLAIAGSWLLLTRGLRPAVARLGRMHPLSSATVFIAIAAPWHVLASLANPPQGSPGALTLHGGHWTVPLPTEGNVHGWAWFYFVNEQLLRYLNLRVPRDYDTVPLALFLGLILVWLMPWSGYLPAAFGRALPLFRSRFRRGLRARTLPPVERGRLLLVLWAGLPLLFFAFSTRQEYYVLPALPPMILLLAEWLAAQDSCGAGARSRSERLPTGALALMGLLVAGGCLLFLLRTGSPLPGTDLASLTGHDPAEYALSFGHLLDLNARALGLFRGPLALSAVAVLAGTAGNFLLRRRGKAHAATLTLAAGAFAFLLAAHWGLVIFSPTLTSAQLARAIATEVRPEDMVAIHGEYEAGSTLGFSLRRTDLHIIEGRSANLWYGSFFPDAPPIFETRASMVARWRGPQRIFLWHDRFDAERPSLPLPGPVYVLAESEGKQILSNQPKR